MSRENEMLDPRMPEDESTPTAHDHENEAVSGSMEETAHAKHTVSDHPLERNAALEPSKRFRLSIIIDLPAPVSPVSTQKPSDRSISAERITAMFSI